MRIRSMVFGILIIILAINGACGKTSEQSITFLPEVYAVTKVSLPEDLPKEICVFSEWTREGEWTKLEETDSENASVYANRDDRENIYIQWGDEFAKINWENFRQMELDIKLCETDLDSDGKAELIAVLMPKGSSNWGIEELHVIERQEEDSWTDWSFPVKTFADWVILNSKIEQNDTVVFREDRIKIAEQFLPGEMKLDSDLRIITFKIVDNMIVIETVLETMKNISVAILEVKVSYDKNRFSGIAYELKSFE